MIPKADLALENIQRLGFKIIIHTAHRPVIDVENWLIDHHLKYPVVLEKPEAVAYIDDRGIRFKDWDNIMTEWFPVLRSYL